MTSLPSAIKGIIHGKMIELEHESGLPEGQEVSVLLQPTSGAGSGLDRSFGAWSDDIGGVDDFLAQVRKDREDGQSEHI